MTLRALTLGVTVVCLATPGSALARQQPPAAAPAPVAAPVEAAPTPAPTAPVVAPTASASDWTAAPAAAPAPAPVVAAPPPRVASPPPPPRVRVTEGNDLIAIGVASFGGLYLITSLAGAVIIDRARQTKVDAYTGQTHGPDRDRVNYGRALTVPVAGPFIAMRYTDSAKERWGNAFVGGMQLAGAVTALVGFARKARARRAQRLAVGGGFAAGGASISLSGRF